MDEMQSTPTKDAAMSSPASASGAPTVPNPTPRTEPLDSEVTEAPPPMDFASVARILDPIQETLNESADAAMYPSPPINTPEAFSPAPSVYKLTGRERGLSLIGDRLAVLKLEGRNLSRLGSDDESSNRSVVPSVDEEGQDGSNIEDIQSDGGSADSGKLEVDEAMKGSPKLNPRLEEFLSFTSKDLPASAATSSVYVDAESSDSSKGLKPTSSLDGTGQKSQRSETGVTEKSNWAAELEESTKMIIMRLEQLAFDEQLAYGDNGKSAKDYFVERCNDIFGDPSRKFPLTLVLKPKVQEE